MDDLTTIYIEDMKEYLVILNDSIMSLERNPEDRAAIGEMFRAFHTMKSSTAAMEFRRTAGFIHRMEDLLHEIREGRLKADTRVIRLLFESNDLLEYFLDGLIRKGTECDLDYGGIMAEVAGILDRRQGKEAGEDPAGGAREKDDGFRLDGKDLEKLKASVAAGRQAYKLTAVISGNCAFKAVRAWMVLEEASKLSEIIRSCPEKPDVEDFKNGSFVFNDTVVRAVIVSGAAPGDLLRELGMSLNEIEDLRLEAINPDIRPGASLDSIAGVPGAQGNCPAGTREDLSEIIDGIIGGEAPARAGHFSEAAGDAENAGDGRKKQAYIRIPANKLDNLVDLMGELLITQSLHKQEVNDISGGDSGKMLNTIMRMERIAKDMQDITMSLRMVSLKQTFQKIYRIGRDTALELGKDVEISISGEDTEIDRNIVEKIHDPLMHLIRNAISHGIESEADRLEKGKTARGNISIQAYNRRGNVYIVISDDGRGLTLDNIYRKALDQGLADPSRKYGDEEIMKLIFLPGFSTEDHVNSISGRGVGMNVVQTEISRLGGKIEIENRPSDGCSFILKIPVNLATINGTIVDICGCNYIIPTLGIKQIFKPRKEQWIYIKGKRDAIMLRNDILRVIPIGPILRTALDDGESETGLIMVVEHEKRLMALPVKAILGKQEVVVKPIGSDFGDLSFISGATILGDGKVSLILDVEALFRMAEDMDREYQIA